MLSLISEHAKCVSDCDGICTKTLDRMNARSSMCQACLNFFDNPRIPYPLEQSPNWLNHRVPKHFQACEQAHRDFLLRRIGFTRYYSEQLASIAEVNPHCAIAASRLMDRDAHNFLQLWQWASSMYSTPLPWDHNMTELHRRCLPMFAAILWSSMPVLGSRLDLAERASFCEVNISNLCFYHRFNLKNSITCYCIILHKD